MLKRGRVLRFEKTRIIEVNPFMSDTSYTTHQNYTMKLFLLSAILFLGLSIQQANCQNKRADEAAETILNNNRQYIRVLNRNVNFYRRPEFSVARSNRRAIKNDLALTKQANASMRDAREQLKNKRLIRKEKIELDVENPPCNKEYNSYVQHACYAYNDPEQPQDSVLLEQYEITVLLKNKKKYYKVCLNGEEYYVLKNQEK